MLSKLRDSRGNEPKANDAESFEQCTLLCKRYARVLALIRLGNESPRKLKLPHGAAKLSTAQCFYYLALNFGQGPDDKTQVDTQSA